jgi:hypothetical protein
VSLSVNRFLYRFVSCTSIDEEKELNLVSFSCSQHQPKIQLLSCPERVTQDNRFGFSAPLSRKLVLDSNSLTDLPLSTNQ